MQAIHFPETALGAILFPFLPFPFLLSFFLSFPLVLESPDCLGLESLGCLPGQTARKGRRGWTRRLRGG